MGALFVLFKFSFDFFRYSSVGWEPSHFLFCFVMVIGVLVGVSAESWYLVWFGLEVNAIAFVCFLSSGEGSLLSESALKYYVVQCLGSGFLLFGVVMFGMELVNMKELFIICGLLMKAGMPPFHFWYPGVMAGVDWVSFFILNTLQKIVPLMSVSLLMGSFWVSILVGLVMIFSGVVGMSQGSVRGLFAYSSMGHMSWMLGSGLGSMDLLVFYLFIYSVSMFGLSFMFFLANCDFISRMGGGDDLSFFDRLVVVAMLFSLGGVPPLIGFVPKWIVVLFCGEVYTLAVALLLLGSIFHLAYYVNFSFFLVMGESMVGVYGGSGGSVGVKIFGVIMVFFHLFGVVWLLGWF